jgi:glycerol-3-phosphate dehydrogenase (NAD(P)+)
MPDVVILGAGVMGAAITVPAAHTGAQVALVGTHLDQDIVESVARDGWHARLGVTLPPNVTAMPWTEFGTAMAGAPDLVILGVSSAGVAWAIDRLVENLKSATPILMLTKGLARRGDAIDALPHLVRREIERRSGLKPPLLAVGGPCIAGELAVERDTSVVVAGPDPAVVAQAIRLLQAPFYHARPSTDLIGVEVCAAFKNFYALAVGAVSGFLDRDGKAANGALMHNLAASIFTEALAEMAVLVEQLGGDASTVAGLAGAGDLYVTCQAGRNGRMGRLLGLGLAYSQAKSKHMPADTVEGAQLALDLGPLLEQLMAERILPEERIPLAAAIIPAICRDEPLRLPFQRFHLH